MVIDKIHPTHVFGILADRELGRALGKLRYDTLAEVLGGLQEEVLRQQAGDASRRRFRLASALGALSVYLGHTLAMLECIVAICRKHINEEKQLRDNT